MDSPNFVSSYFDAWNQHDAGGVAEHLTQGGTYCDIPIQQQLTRDALVAHLNDFFSRDTNQYLLAGEVLTGKNSIAFQYRACPASDLGVKNAGWMGAEFIIMSGDAADRIEDYYPNQSDDDLENFVPGIANHAGVERYAKSGLNAQGLQEMMADLTTLMKSQRVYLRPDLSLPQLATHLNCSVNHVSQAINAGFAVSFFDYINQYRIHYAKGILSGEDCNAAGILDVALAAGFNSTSTFYTAFKKCTGHTPAQYRRRSLESSRAT